MWSTVSASSPNVPRVWRAHSLLQVNATVHVGWGGQQWWGQEGRNPSPPISICFHHCQADKSARLFLGNPWHMLRGRRDIGCWDTDIHPTGVQHTSARCQALGCSNPSSNRQIKATDPGFVKLKKKKTQNQTQKVPCYWQPASVEESCAKGALHTGCDPWDNSVQPPPTYNIYI